ncbi:hypothetical protein OJ998_28680 [Solirubrobacter taibaiensis]|nr:hypothetical protein [Solirubrobacter taibaiensis]
MSAAPLPERASVFWRAPMTPARLRTYARAWTITTAAQVVPMMLVAALMVTLHPVAAVVGGILLLHAWAIPELYANRGAKVVKPRARLGETEERTALGLLGDLVGHEARELHARTGLVMERGALGVWLVGEAGALLVRGRRVHCWCVRVPDATLPSSDRIAHLLLALREDEEGFATVANHAFAGARWRVRRRLPKSQRPALAAATRLPGGTRRPLGDGS